MLTQNDLKQIGELIDQKLEQKLDKKLRPIKKDLGLIISFFDNKIVGLRRRVERIESHLELSSL